MVDEEEEDRGTGVIIHVRHNNLQLHNDYAYSEPKPDVKSDFKDNSIFSNSLQNH